MASRQIKSRERVQEHGEVFTAEREVNAMLDLVKSETERIDSRFLEPACGEGAFLIEILRRKLAVVKDRYKNFPSEYEKYSILALSSIYGVDLLQDNVDACIEILYTEWDKQYTSNCKKEANDRCREAARYILSHNILCGNALTLEQEDGTPIIFAQWDLITGDKMKRRDYMLDALMKTNNDEMDMQMWTEGWEYDNETEAWIPAPIKEYPLTNYWEVQKYA